MLIDQSIFVIPLQPINKVSSRSNSKFIHLVES